MEVYLRPGDSIASKPIAKRVIPVVMLGREPFLDEPPLSGEVLACPPQANLRRFVSLTKNDHTPHMGRNPDMSVAFGTKHGPDGQLKPVGGRQGIFNALGDTQYVVGLAKPYAARTQKTQSQLWLAEGASQNVSWVEECAVHGNEAELISHGRDQRRKAAPILSLADDRLRVEAQFWG